MAEQTVSMTNNEDTAPVDFEATRSNARYVSPPVDIYEEKDALVVVADLPGASKESVSVDVKDGILTMQAVAKSNFSNDPLHREFEFVNFYRQFELSEAVNVDAIGADLTHGVLKINLPKAEKAKPKKIAVNFAH